MNRIALAAVALLLWGQGLHPGARAAEPAAAGKSFTRDVLPILTASCLRCHGAAVQKAGLDLRSAAAMVRGGETGPALSPGSAEKSLLWLKIAADQMPPGKTKLTEAEKTLIRAWIDGGAPDDGAPAQVTADQQVSDAERQFWSFQPPVRPPVPVVSGARVRNPIDAFILDALKKKGMTLAPEAERLTLLRRVHFDLTGLPPTPAEIEAFQNDASPDAYEKLIDRLLASPHYGERWGRHWLDLAGYADSEGILDADYVRSAAWRYRDYVIRAFNADKPYDRFLQEQIAGDELTDYWTVRDTQPTLPPEVVEALTATGYLRCACDTSRPDFVSIKNAPGYYYQTLDDTLRIVASSTMGLTVHCAKCHSHKYDPIPQADYYRMQAIFMSGYRPGQWVPQVQRRLLEATAVQEKEAQAHNAKVDAAVGMLRKKLDELRQTFAERLFNDRLAKLPEAIREDVRQALAAVPAKRTEVQKYLADKFQKDLRPQGPALVQELTKHYADFAAQAAKPEAAIKEEEAKRIVLPEIRALYDLPGEPKTPLLRRGDYLNHGPEMAPGTLSVLATARPFAWNAPPKEARTSGRRLAFAQWLTHPDHPLTSRVLVNRLWLQHFGVGLVATPDNFGRTGAPPSHPELLDWLATEFVARGWSIKAMHRLILTSSTYRQSSAAGRESMPDAWRQRLRRLEGEPLRDAMLRVAGRLNPQRFGPPVPMVRQGDGEVSVPDDANGRRRSIYLQVRRSQPLTFLQLFDQPVMETNCTARATSTVSSQALSLLNSEFVTRQSAALAERAAAERPADPVGYALLLAFGRPATEREKILLKSFVDEQAARYQDSNARQRALADLCHMLLSANEFAYVD